MLGALMLSTEGTDIDAAVRDVRLEILGVFAIVFTITVLLSLYLAGTSSDRCNVWRGPPRMCVPGAAARHSNLLRAAMKSAICRWPCAI